MAEGFKIADAYVEVEAEIDRSQVTASATEAGDQAGRAMGDSLVRGADGKLRDSRGRFAKTGERAGSDLGESAGRSMGRTMGSVLSGHLPTIFSNPYILGAAATAGALLAPALGAGLAGAIIGGSGIGVIAGGIALIAKDPRIQSATGKLKNSLLDIDTSETEAQLAQWRERLADARKAGNEDAIKEARGHVQQLSKDLAAAQAFNAKNVSLRDYAKVFIEPTTKALGIFAGALDRIKPKIGAMFDSLAKSGAIESLATGLVGMVEKALPGFMKMIEASGPFLVKLGPGLEKLGEGLGFFFDQIAAAGPDAATFFGDLLSFLSGQIAMWGAIIRWLSMAYTKMRTFFTSIPGWVSAAGSWFANLWSGITSKGSAVLSWFGALPGRIGGWISGAVSAVQEKGAALLGWFAALPGRIGAWLATLPGKARAFFVKMFDTITYLVGFGIGTVVKFFATLPGRIWSAAVGLVGRVRTLFTQARTTAVSLATSLASSVVSFFLNLPGRVYSAAIGIVSRIRSIMSSARSTASSTASSIVSSVFNIIRTLPGRVGSALASFASTVAGKLRAAVSSAYSIGRDIIQGVINGIGSMVGAAISAAKRAAGNIVSGMKDALGIGSPSKVMAREVGRWLLPGVGVGVKSSIPAAKRAVQSAADSLVPSVPGAAGSGVREPLSGPGMGANYYFAPGSIVIDASSLRSISDLLKMIDRLESSARAMKPRMATVGA